MGIYSVHWLDANEKEWIRLIKATSESEAVNMVDEALNERGDAHLILRAIHQKYYA